MSGHRAVRGAGLGSGHTCCLYRHDEELRRVAARFVRRGLQEGARSLWLWDRHSPDEIEAFLRQEGIEIGRHRATGDLELRSVDRTLVRSGRFRPGDALAFVRKQVEAAAEHGYAGIHIVLEAGGLAARLDDPGPLLHFETALNGLVEELPLALLCPYRLGEVPAQIVLDAVETHSDLALDGRLVPGGTARHAERGLAAGAPKPTLLRMPSLSPGAERPGASTDPTLLELLADIEAAGERGAEEETLRAALEAICQRTGWPVGHVWLPNATEEHLSSSGIWYLEDPDRFRRLREAARAVRFHQGVGLPGTAWERGEPVHVGDLTGGRSFFGRQGQELLGIRVALAVPLRHRDRVLAVIELSSPQASDPDPEQHRVLGYAGLRLAELLAMKRMERRLEASERRLRALEEAAPNALVVTDEEGRIVSWSSGAADLFGSAADDVIGTSLSAFIPEWHRKVDNAVLERYLTVGDARIRGHTVELHGVRKDGEAFPLELSITSWESDGARFFGNLVRDRTRRTDVGAEPAPIEHGRWNIGEAVLITTGAGPEGQATILYASPAFLEMTGYEDADVAGRDIGILSGPATDAEALARIRRALQRGESLTEQLTAYRKDGSEFPMKWSVAALPESGGRPAPFIHIQTDLRRQRQAEEALKRAEADALTGLANRAAFLSQVKRCIDRRRTRPDYRFAVLFLDLDDFKEVNDSRGHVVGDEVLFAVARRLERSVRPSDTVARYGGDEFAILLEFVLDVEDAITVAERIRSEISEPLSFDGREVVVSGSIGIALSDTGYSSPLGMVEDADAAMYRAKQEGPARYRIYDEHLHREVLSALRMESELLRSARETDFALHYQPLVALSSGRILGFEALLRWRHPELGFLPAERFIALAERTGLIVSIGEWVLREGCRQIQEWQRSLELDPPLVLNVNVSGKELSEPGFVDRVREILAETGMDPSHLHLELNENALAEEHDRLRETLAGLRELGIATCIDDFGTGSASLAQVLNLAPGTLKVDRMLVGRLGMERGGTGSAGGEVIRAILSLARDLGLKSIAEGVETPAQREQLIELGCEFGQGYFFSASVDAEAADELLRSSGELPRVNTKHQLTG